MKILLFSTLYQPNIIGGAEESTRLIAEGYAKRGYVVEVITTSDKDYQETVNGVVVHYMKFHHVFWRYKSKQQSFIKKVLWRIIERNNFLNNNIIKVKLREIQPDVVHTNNIAGIGVDIWRIAKEMDVKVMHTARDYYMICVRSGMFKNGKACEGQCAMCKIYTSRYKKYSEYVDGFVGVSDFVKNMHVSNGYFPNNRYTKGINNIYNARRSYFKKEKKPESPLVFGILGVIRESKGVLSLFENIKQLDGVKYVVAGKFQNVKTKKQFYNAINGKDVEYLGYIEPEEFFSKIDYLIHPALWYEPFPRVLIESFSYGVPVIGSHNGGTKEAIKGLDTGYIYHNYQELEEILTKLASGDFDYHILQTNCLEYSKKFSEEVIIGEYERVIDHIT